MAVGLPNAKRDSRVYYAEPGINQNYHVAGMPLGTRGGMLVEHFFPADGDYEFTAWNAIDHMVTAPVPEGDLDSWHHVAGVFDGSSYRLYRDGELLAEFTINPTKTYQTQNRPGQRA